MEINKAAVLGAGVMGAGIAAHLANAGVEVELLDIVPETGDRSAIAKGAIDRMLKTEPAAFMHKRNAKLVTPGNIEDHLDRTADVDWIVEAVIEDLEIKRTLYRRLDAVRKTDSVVSSNTSTIPLRLLMDGMPDGLAENFMITHFFNPPRYMRLLEIVAGQKTRTEAVETVREFADLRLGKGVVDCKDTPGFIANRIGAFWMQIGVVEAIDMGVTIEEADAVMSRPMGIPKTGIFALIDLVGLDLMPLVGRSMRAALPDDDPFCTTYREPELVKQMIEKGLIGRKAKGGFYRLNKQDGQRVKEAIDLKTGEYHRAAKPRLDSVEAARDGLRNLMEHSDIGGRYARRVMSQVLAYAASLVPEISDSIVGVDEAMRIGYNWKYGPFELIDRMGAKWFADTLEAEGKEVPKLLALVGDGSFYRTDTGKLQYLTLDGAYADVARRPGVAMLSDIKLGNQPLAANPSASLWDLGDGVVCLEFHTKMNALDPDSLAMIREAIEITGRDQKALVIYNEGSNFSVGVNIGNALFAANLALWPQIEEMVAAGQQAYMALKYAPFPVVGAPSGMALGGGCEILLHCDAVQAHAETYIGLVEVGVGLVPAWGGCTEMLIRAAADPMGPRGPMPAVSKAFQTIGLAQVAKSAEEAKGMLFLRPHDRITPNRDRLLADAKAFALELAKDYRPPEPPEIAVPGKSGKVALNMVVEGLARAGKATPHDKVVAKKLAHVLTGGEARGALSEDDLMALEREAIIFLVKQPATMARIEHMLETGKPLRN